MSRPDLRTAGRTAEVPGGHLADFTSKIIAGGGDEHNGMQKILPHHYRSAGRLNKSFMIEILLTE